MIKYRPEIDGLRAIAVLSVVVYHADFSISAASYFKGGYVGVDVFFVISGYLISLIILKDLAKGKFSYSNFYERRARRILPALFTVMLASIPIAWLLLLPDGLTDFAGSILSSLAFGSNFWFWLSNGYWEEASALKPFLHTWSLSVEEQFYVVFPILLLLLWKYSFQSMMTVFLVIALASLLCAQVFSVNHPSFTFYLLPARAWELLIGAMLAKYELDKGRNRLSVLGLIMPVFGVLMIIGSVAMFNKNTLHPSLITIIPVFGTAFIILFANSNDICTRILSSKPFVKIGLISYGFYLWHYPVFAFARIHNSSPSNVEKIGWIALSLILAALTYYLVEQPFRRKFSSRTSISSLILITIALIVIMSTIIRENGYPNRLPQILSDNFNQRPWTEMVDEQGRQCFGDYGKEDFCNKSGTNATQTIMLVGDSTTESISSKLTPLLLDRDFRVISMNSSTCLYLPGFYSVSNGVPREIPNEPCDNDFQLKRVAKIAEHPGSIIILGGMLNRYINNKAFLSIDGIKSIQEGYLNAVQGLLDDGYKVVQLSPFPQFKESPSKLLKNVQAIGGTVDETSTFYQKIASYPLTDHEQSMGVAFKLFNQIEHENFYLIRPDMLFCDTYLKGVCVSNDGDKLFFVDQVHAANQGAKLISEYIVKEIELLE